MGEKRAPSLIVNLITVPRGIDNVQPQFNAIFNDDCKENVKRSLNLRVSSQIPTRRGLEN